MRFFILLILAFSSENGDCLMFLQGTTSLNLPFDFPVGTSFHRLSVIDENTGRVPEGPPTFTILKSAVFSNASKSAQGLFLVDRHVGSLLLAPHRKHSLAEFKGCLFALDLVAKSTNNLTAHTTIVISIVGDSFSAPECRPREDLCFSSAEIHYQVPETVANNTLLGVLRPISYKKLCPKSKTKYVFEYENKVIAVDTDGKVETAGPFDYERAADHEWNASCTVLVGNETDTFQARIRVSVTDVDDNPPFKQKNTRTVQELGASQIQPGSILPVQLTVLDADSPSVNKIEISLDDPLKLFTVQDPVIFPEVIGNHMLISSGLETKPRFRFAGTTYNVSVIFNDTSYIGNPRNGQVVFHIIINNDTFGHPGAPSSPDELQVVARVFRYSSHHARVVQAMKVQHHEGYFFRLKRDSNVRDRIFGVTPITGIVYVMDEVALARSAAKLFYLQLTWRNRNVTDRQCLILIHVLDIGDSSKKCVVEPGLQFPSCAVHTQSESCTSSCGRGALSGFCQWRSQAFNTLVKEYATCSPHLQSCPDGTCDELEEMDPYLCPQDCAGNVLGEAVPGSHGKGISKSAASCRCLNPDTCICFRFDLIGNALQPISQSPTIEVFNTPSRPVKLPENWSGCGHQCITMIVLVSLVVSGLVVVAGFLFYRRFRSQSKKPDFPTVLTPLNSASHLVNAGSQDTTQRQTTTCASQLEFSRDSIVFEETLGEGEFGKVVKGQAWNIGGRAGYTTVAVKMLKDESSASERRDLISELNLLKEISHPNVIGLLGACADKNGPLYVIMEYAEHGSLERYLRNMRHQCREAEVDFLEFSLQIAKGMDYLSSMKVVHRDLAARNVLVDSNKTLKISDFGLSRDVYEGDTYLRMSKGKIPVKWIALESLETQLYTTKSDVWSFGIVLWEIITVGGCPYPGIPTERLFQLLKDAYRMPKPDNCPQPLYDLMKSCWLEKPRDRPHFKELVQKIQSLQKDFANPLCMQNENFLFMGKKAENEGDRSLLQQLTSFPRLSVQDVGPYENQCLISPGEFSV